MKNQHEIFFPHTVSLRKSIALTLVCLLFFVASLGCFLNSNSHSYDYTDRASQVDSVSYVRVTAIETYGQGNNSDVFEYTELKKLDSVPTETILNDLASLEYRYPLGHPYFVREDQKGIILQFNSDSADLIYVLYCQGGYVVVRKCDRGFKVDNYGPYCDETQWNQLMETYVKGID